MEVTPHGTQRHCSIHSVRKESRRNDPRGVCRPFRAWLAFFRELEAGKETVRMDKVNQALAMFGMEAVPGRKKADE